MAMMVAVDLFFGVWIDLRTFASEKFRFVLRGIPGRERERECIISIHHSPQIHTREEKTPLRPSNKLFFVCVFNGINPNALIEGLNLNKK